MTTTIHQLASELKTTAEKLNHSGHHWIGLAGAPGSGKSTLANALQSELDELLTVIPMDGYHFYRHELDAMPDPAYAHARRGAPFTFNAQRFVNDLLEARNSGQGSFPGFDHGIGDPVEDAVLLCKGRSSVVLVEGNYLLLDDEPWCRLRTDVFDETWFLDVPVEVCKQRVFERHMATGRSEKEASTRVNNNDGPNAEIVSQISKKNADRIIQLA